MHSAHRRSLINKSTRGRVLAAKRREGPVRKSLARWGSSCCARVELSSGEALDNVRLQGELPFSRSRRFCSRPFRCSRLTAISRSGSLWRLLASSSIYQMNRRPESDDSGDDSEQPGAGRRPPAAPARAVNHRTCGVLASRAVTRLASPHHCSALRFLVSGKLWTDAERAELKRRLERNNGQITFADCRYFGRTPIAVSVALGLSSSVRALNTSDDCHVSQLMGEARARFPGLLPVTRVRHWTTLERQLAMAVIEQKGDGDNVMEASACRACLRAGLSSLMEAAVLACRPFTPRWVR